MLKIIKQDNYKVTLKTREKQQHKDPMAGTEGRTTPLNRNTLLDWLSYLLKSHHRNAAKQKYSLPCFLPHILGCLLSPAKCKLSGFSCLITLFNEQASDILVQRELQGNTNIHIFSVHSQLKHLPFECTIK